VSKISSLISQDLLNGPPALYSTSDTILIMFRMMIKDDPKHLAVVVVGFHRSPRFKNKLFCAFFDLFLNILQHAGILVKI